MSLLRSYLVFQSLINAALSYPPHGSSSLLDRADVGSISNSLFGRPITLTSSVLPDALNTTNATNKSYICQLQPSPDQAARGPIDVRDCYQIVATLLRRDDLEIPRTFNANTTPASWTYGTCAIVLKPNATTADSSSLDTFAIIDIARAAATISTTCLSTSPSFPSGVYIQPIGSRALFHIGVVYRTLVREAIPSSTQPAVALGDGPHPDSNDSNGPAIHCSKPAPALLVPPLSEPDCNYLIASILTRTDVLSTKTFFQLAQANTLTVPNSNNNQNQTLQAYPRFQTPWGLDKATCTIRIFQLNKEEDSFRLIEVPRHAALILAKCRVQGQPQRGGTVPVGPKEDFLVAVRGITVTPPPVS